ncbi:hypothetical protein HNO92_004009 [Chromobacterium alkanivorans]|uniref:hypothetical protein n=1 Tax=Chromobacterium TaxID=535 RepID=UPI0012E139E4|nr:MULTISPECIES: hypothetical protein [Chromobacterium]MCS3803855.1 hypothetical protein [Chromobacterium alkanivorans]MCS3818040.1 hypothetical protein [Chromobacterium alkanivorans]MCS3875660.1 hypothetical protein [Chromobacterium alkanivorans]
MKQLLHGVSPQVNDMRAEYLLLFACPNLLIGESGGKHQNYSNVCIFTSLNNNRKYDNLKLNRPKDQSRLAKTAAGSIKTKRRMAKAIRRSGLAAA